MAARRRRPPRRRPRRARDRTVHLGSVQGGRPRLGRDRPADLWDFQANVDGAKVEWEGFRPLLQRKDEALDKQIEEAFTKLQSLLDKHREGEGFVTYDKLSDEDVKQLADAVNALSEPLSKMSGAILS
ncbi:imelysin family protein [Tessaracoccus flavescens]|uniref:imelysin family protein n=1 Tax=Tessaracoccus flavescens TaxID=399497 RepID=UPI00126036F4